MSEFATVPSSGTLLQRAAGLALAHPEDTADRWTAIHQVALIAVQLQEDETLGRLMAALDSPAHQAHLQAARARKWESLGVLDTALEHARGAVEALEQPGRWRPVLPDWVGPDCARAEICSLLVFLGDDRAAAAVARDLRVGTMHHVRSVAALSRLLPAADGWETVGDSVGAIDGPTERARAVLAVLDPRSPAPRLGPDARHALRLIDAVVGLQGGPRAAACGVRVAVHLARVFLEVPALTAAVEAWERAVSLAGDCPGDDTETVAELCAVTQAQLVRVGLGPASLTWQGLLERLAATPLPPDPPHRGPWASVLAVALDHPQLAVPLARIVARHPAVPSSWAHALGMIHLACGRPDRAARVAEVLAGAADRHTEDHESRLLAGLLYARSNDGDSAWNHLLAALGDDGPRLAWLAGAEGPQRYEAWSVDALLESDFPDLAVLYGRMLTEPGLRAALLARCLKAMPADERPALAEEVVDALAEARAEGSLPPMDASLAQLPEVVWTGGDPARAVDLLDRWMRDLLPTGTAAWLSGTTHIHTALAAVDLGTSGLGVPWVVGWQQRLDAAPLEERLELLLGWVQLARQGEGR